MSTPVNTTFEPTSEHVTVTKDDNGGIKLSQPESYNNYLVSEVPPSDQRGSGKDIMEQKFLLLERKAECLDLNVLIKDLEERNRVLTKENEQLTNKLEGQTKVRTMLCF